MNAKAFYRSAEWLAKRLEILIRDNFECQKCKRRGQFSPAESVHHIKHLQHRPDLALTDSNLISLCNACHNEEHPEKLHQQSCRKRAITAERW